MFRTTAFAAGLLAAIGWSSSARATETDTQLWLGASAEAPLGGGLTLSADASQRFRAPSAGGDIQLYRIGGQVQTTDWLSLGGGVAYLDSDAADETRLFQSVSLKWGNLLARTQLEERYFDGSPRPQLRGRQRLQLTVPLDADDRLLSYVELNYILRNQNPAVGAAVDHWRLKLDWRHRLAAHMELSAAYMAMYAPRPGTQDRLSHVPSLSVFYTF
ncbi:MAG: DUF2490 domain-containing protein [Novosphingobium sp.]|nr:DUF2490 domain-containing protein [Novosphingobium sp.]